MIYNLFFVQYVVLHVDELPDGVIKLDTNSLEDENEACSMTFLHRDQNKSIFLCKDNRYIDNPIFINDLKNEYVDFACVVFSPRNYFFKVVDANSTYKLDFQYKVFSFRYKNIFLYFNLEEVCIYVDAYGFEVNNAHDFDNFTCCKKSAADYFEETNDILIIQEVDYENQHPVDLINRENVTHYVEYKSFLCGFSQIKQHFLIVYNKADYKMEIQRYVDESNNLSVKILDKREEKTIEFTFAYIEDNYRSFKVNDNFSVFIDDDMSSDSEEMDTRHDE